MPELLHFIDYPGPAGPPPLLIAHGLFGSARNWGVIARKLAADRRVVAVDMRNHGDSFRSDDHSYRAQADDLAAVIGALGGNADVLGHSMGGKAAMVLALLHPGLVNKLVVVDIAPVAYAHSHAANFAAMRALDLAEVSRRADAEAQLAPPVPDPSLRAFFLQSLSITPEGARWKLNLAALEQNQRLITGFPEMQAQFTGPVLFLCGENSDYVQAAHHAEIRRLFPAARFVQITGAGHWLHADQPAATVQAVSEFLHT